MGAVSTVQFIQSRDNPQLRMVRKLASDNTAYRKAGRFWIEGEHLCSAALLRGTKPAMAFFSESGWARAPRPEVAAAVYVLGFIASSFSEPQTKWRRDWRVNF